MGEVSRFGQLLDEPAHLAHRATAAACKVFLGQGAANAAQRAPASRPLVVGLSVGTFCVYCFSVRFTFWPLKPHQSSASIGLFGVPRL